MSEEVAPVGARRLAPPILAATLLAAVGRGAMFLLIPIDGLELGGIFGGFAVPGMFALGAVTTNIPGAILVSRFGHKPAMVGGLLTAIAGALGVALSESLLFVTLAAFAYGVGGGLWGFARLSYLSDMVDVTQRGRVVSAVGGSHRMGLFAGPALGGLAASALGRSTAVTLVALCVVIALLIVIAVLPPGRTLPSPAGAHPLSMVRRVIADHRRTFATAGVAMLTLSLVRQARMLLVPICGVTLGLDTADIGFVKSLSMGADMALFYPAGLIMDRFGRKWTAVPCLTLLSLGVLAIGTAGSYLQLALGGLLAGIGNGLGSGINMTLAGDFSPREGRADFLGVWKLISDTGGSSSPFVMGTIASALALGPAAAVAAAVGLSGALLMALLVQETRRPQPATEPAD
ncbi:MAG: MFS transporter [Myxococcales bacterium]